jgi:hypothetical protein
MNVLADFHHHDLFYSLQLLFEKRLGWNLYRPIGMEWLNEGYWRYSLQADTAQQFLGLDQAYKPSDGTPALNQIAETLEDGIYIIRDTVHNGFEKAVTLPKFKQMKFDIIISSVSQHDITFQQLINDCQANAKHISHIGNIFQQREGNVKNLLISTKEANVPEGVNAVFYHQEFDLNVYKFRFPSDNPKRTIKSFQNCLPNLFPEDYAIYKKLKELLPEFDFKSYGGSCDNGSLQTDRQIAYEMENTMFAFHCKKLGDGFGHVIHNWFAMGKSVITRGSDYKGKLAGDLLVDGVTCFDIEKNSLEDIAGYIKDMTAEEYQSMSLRTYDKFKEVVDFDKEFLKIQEFLSKLI